MYYHCDNCGSYYPNKMNLKDTWDKKIKRKVHVCSHCFYTYFYKFERWDYCDVCQKQMGISDLITIKGTKVYKLCRECNIKIENRVKMKNTAVAANPHREEEPALIIRGGWFI